MKKTFAAITFAVLLGAAGAGVAQGDSAVCGGAATGTDEVLCDEACSVQAVPQEKGDGFREANYIMMPSPTGVSASSTPNAGCSPSSGTANVTVSYTMSPYVQLNGVSVLPPAGCTPGVTLDVSSPPGSAGRIASYISGRTSITDPTPRAIGTQFTYTLTGVCTNGSGSAGVGVADSTPFTVNITPSCVCGAAPVFTGVMINNVSADSITADNLGGLSLLEGAAATISGIIVDNDSNKASMTVVLEYGNADSSPEFPGYSQITARPSSSGAFLISIPADAVKAETDLYWALSASDTSAACGRANYPTTYAGTKNTAAVIPGNGIKKGHCLCWSGPPYPSQMPFRAGNGEVLHIRFILPEEANVVMTLYAMDGRLVRQITSSAGDPESVANICAWDAGCSWDGTTMDGPGSYVPNGLYIMNLSAQTSNGELYDDYTKGIVVMK